MIYTLAHIIVVNNWLVTRTCASLCTSVIQSRDITRDLAYSQLSHMKHLTKRELRMVCMVNLQSEYRVSKNGLLTHPGNLNTGSSQEVGAEVLQTVPLLLQNKPIAHTYTYTFPFPGYLDRIYLRVR